ncbi:MAG: hypothetical protein ACREFZ_00660, partial [Acetobacteraceae bacterium]
PAELPLFAAAPAPETAAPAPSDPVHAMIAEIEPDTLTPRAALDFLYRLKASLPVRTSSDSLPCREC